MVEANLLATDLAVLMNAASGYLTAGHVLAPQGSGHVSIVPYQAFRAADGFGDDRGRQQRQALRRPVS